MYTALAFTPTALHSSVTFLRVSTHDGCHGVQVDWQLYGEGRSYMASLPTPHT